MQCLYSFSNKTAFQSLVANIQNTFQVKYKIADTDRSWEKLKSQQKLLKVSEAALIIIFFKYKGTHTRTCKPQPAALCIIVSLAYFQKVRRDRQDKLFLFLKPKYSVGHCRQQITVLSMAPCRYSPQFCMCLFQLCSLSSFYFSIFGVSFQSSPFPFRSFPSPPQ